MKSKPKANICVIYYNKFDDSFVKSIPIKNCTLNDIENVLLNVYPNEKHIQLDENGNEYIKNGTAYVDKKTGIYKKENVHFKK